MKNAPLRLREKIGVYGIMSKWSVSKLKTLITCPFQYYLKYVVPYEDRIKGQDTLSRVLGIAVHEAVEKDNESSPLDELETLFRNTYLFYLSRADLVVRPGDNVNSALNRGLKMVGNYRKLLPELTGKHVRKEHKFEFPYYGHTLVGKIDWISDNMVCDFKTGKYDPYPEFLPYDLQFAIYRLGYMTEFRGEPKLYWVSLETGKAHEVKLKEEYLVSPSSVLDYLTYAEKYAEFLEDTSGYFPLARQGLSTACNNCDYKYECIS